MLKASVADAIIILGQDTPFTIDSLIFINGFPWYFKIDKTIIPNSGGIAVPKLLIQVNAVEIHFTELVFNKLGRTHNATTKRNVPRIIFSPWFALGISFFILSNSLDFRFIFFVFGLIKNLNTSIINANIIIPVGIA